MLDYWAGKGPRPSEKEAQDALDELLHAVRCENNIYHRDVTDALFRQVYSDEAIPFKQHVMEDSLTIPAVEYDLGRQGVAYFDRDSASYQYTPGVKTQGNRGRVCRNDGVDITADPGGYHIFSIEDGEWLQYTLDVKKEGAYTIWTDTTGYGQISFFKDGQLLVHMVDGVYLSAGRHQIRVVAAKGGFLFYALHFRRS
jgi:hypothetical protein